MISRMGEHTADVEKYVRSVETGKRLAGQYERAAVTRYLADIAALSHLAAEGVYVGHGHGGRGDGRD